MPARKKGKAKKAAPKTPTGGVTKPKVSAKTTPTTTPKSTPKSTPTKANAKPGPKPSPAKASPKKPAAKKTVVDQLRHYRIKYFFHSPFRFLLTS